jgi:hypothetical protein
VFIKLEFHSSGKFWSNGSHTHTRSAAWNRIFWNVLYRSFLNVQTFGSLSHVPENYNDRLAPNAQQYLWSGKDTTTGAKCKVNCEKVCHSKKLRGGLGFLIWIDLQGPLDSDGHGSSGKTPTKFGWAPGAHALRRTWRCSMHQLLLLSEMGIRLRFGTLHGYIIGNQLRLPL